MSLQIHPVIKHRVLQLYIKKQRGNVWKQLFVLQIWIISKPAPPGPSPPSQRKWEACIITWILFLGDIKYFRPHFLNSLLNNSHVALITFAELLHTFTPLGFTHAAPSSLNSLLDFHLLPSPHPTKVIVMPQGSDQKPPPPWRHLFLPSTRAKNVFP